MAKRIEKQRGPRQPTPKEARRSKHSQEQERTLLIGAGAVIAAILLILGIGYYQENIAAPRKPVAVVNGETITTQDYQNMVNYQRFDLIARFGGQIDTQTLASYFDSQLPLSVFDSMIDQVLVEQHAAELGITVTNEEVQLAIEREFGFDRDAPTPAPTPDDAGITETTPSGYISREDFTTGFASFVKALQEQAGISEATYREIRRGEIRRDRVQEQIVADLPATGRQAHARHILVETEEEAQAVRQRLLDGEDFAALAEEASTDSGSAANGGDLGWFTLGQMVPEFEAVAFSIESGQISPPVKSEFGYHLIQVLERDDNRPLSPEQLQQARQKHYEDWLDEQRAVSDIQRFWTQDVVPTMPAASGASG